ncbi:MAG TPA: PKD domain-containing protein [Fulvivirga sp.]|nr:PKD domain-containing protein [Fulvivirga sp.]
MKIINILLLNLLALTTFSQSSGIQATKYQGCIPLAVTFNTNLTNVKSYNWDFKNGDVSSIAAPSILFETVGEFNVSLTVTYNNNNQETFNIATPIKVADKPAPDFTITATEYCNNTPITFTNLTSDASTYLWDFGDGESSTQTNPNHAYDKGGVYTVSLIAYNELGCAGLVVKQNLIRINEVEGLTIGSNKTIACTNSSTIEFSSPDTYTSWLWDFGDGKQATTSSANHTYSGAGKYNVSLQVQDKNGCTSSIIKNNYIEIKAPPTPSISYSDSLLCVGGQILFKNLTKNTENVLWSFSDGYSTSENSFSRTFDTPGDYDLVVIINGDNGCTTQLIKNKLITVVDVETPDIDITNTVGCSPLTSTFINNTPGAIAYDWEVDGVNYTSKTFEHIFEQPGTYSVIAKTVYNSGCVNINTYESLIVVNSDEISISADNYTGCQPLTTQFSFSNNNVSNIVWDFGNGKTSDELAPTVVYNNSGQYTARATYTNEYGCVQTITLDKPIIVNKNSINYSTPDKPIYTCEAVNVYFRGGMGKEFWEWDFGDGNTSDLMNPSHFYSEPGSYNVSLKTNNEFGCTSVISNYNHIIVSQISASFTAAIVDTTAGCPNFTVQFESTTTDADKYLWRFDGGITSTSPNPTASFATNGQISAYVTAWDNNGCYSTTSELIASPWLYCEVDFDGPGGSTILPDSLFEYHNYINLCSAPSEIKFANPAMDAKSWYWDFGDGNNSSEKTPSHVFQSEGIYQVDIIVEFNNGNIDTLENYTEVVIQSPDIDYNYVVNEVCGNYEVQFSSLDSDASLWEWDFGDGTTSTQKDPIKVFTKSGVFQVQLKTRDTLTCEVQIVKNVIIGNPYLQFDYSNNICQGETINIKHNIEGFSKFAWDFGDGAIVNAEEPSHNYTERGTYSIKLTLEDKSGCFKEIELPNPVVVNDPKADFEVVGKDTGCNSLSVKFKNNSVGANNWQWTFGNDSTSINKNPAITYSSGTYDVTLIAGQAGCYDTLRKSNLIQVDYINTDFSYSQNQVCLPSEVVFTDKSTNATSWHWDFRDGHFSTEQNPTHTYETMPETPVILTVENATGCQTKKKISIGPFFNPDFTSEVVSGCEPLEVNFSADNKNTISWFWDFGDGNTATTKTVSHIYKTKGNYTVKLISESKFNCYDTLIKENYIKVEGVKSLFKANYSESTCVPFIVSFENQSVGANKYHWIFGDNSTSSSPNPVHIYSTVGEFDVSLVSFNSVGCRDTLTLQNLVNATGPDTDFEMSDTSVCYPQSIQFYDKSASSNSWKWFFGDGNISELQNPEYAYTQPGRYEITLLATDLNGCQQKAHSKYVNVIPVPVAKFDVGDYDYCLPVTVNVNNQSTNLQNESFTWDFGNNYETDSINPIVTYIQPGMYTVSLTVSNEGICTDTFTYNKEITVYDTTYQEQPNVFVLTVANDKSIEMQYEPYPNNNYRYEVVYKNKNAQNEFVVCDTIWHSNSTKYNDTEVFTMENSYAYRIQTHLYCNSPAPIDELITYKSILLTSVGSESIDNDIHLKWTAYEGHGFDYYSIIRSQDSGPWKDIDKVDPGTLSFTDSEDLCPGIYHYKILAVNLDNNEYYSASNTIEASPIENVFLKQKVDVIRTTIEENKYTYTEWKDPEIGPDKVLYYEILKSTDGVDFESIDKVPKGINSYFDQDVDIEKQRYIYKIAVVNTCDVIGEDSNTGSSINLQKQADQYINKLYWTPYSGWKGGTSKYLLQRLNEYGQWEVVQIIDSTQVEHIIDLSKEN